jgi:hypothetical protein
MARALPENKTISPLMLKNAAHPATKRAEKATRIINGIIILYDISQKRTSP